MLDLLFGNDSKQSFTNRPTGQVHEYYLTGPIGRAEEYTSWFNVIRHAGENDIIMLYINSPGGDMFTAIQFLSVLKETEATVVVKVEGACMSAATMIMLGGDKFMLDEHCMFMYHNYSGGTIGKGGEMYDNITYERKWSKKFMHDIYKDFLNKSEIDKMLDGKDLWLTSDEVADRLRKKAEAMKKEIDIFLEELGVDAAEELEEVLAEMEAEANRSKTIEPL